MASVAVKRFYDRVGVRCAAKAEYLVTLDGRDLRTPAKKLLSLPTEGLAWAIASEWEAPDLSAASNSPTAAAMVSLREPAARLRSSFGMRCKLGERR